ncbi:MAG: DNA translocase FtsK [Saprospirales bacterium]|nr:MAG: DNA translocase FtsK [Saprospirales bacterium]
MARRGRKKKSKNFFSVFSKNQSIRGILGLFIIAVSLYLAIALISYIFTWKEDFALVGILNGDFLMDSDQQAKNWMGRLGAFLSNYFFFYGFGLSSLVIPFIIFKFGELLTFGGSASRLFTNTLYSLYTLVLLAVIFDFFSTESDFPWGGGIGQSIQIWISDFIGRVGTVILLLFLTATYVILLFNINLREIKGFERLPSFKLPGFLSSMGKKQNADNEFEDENTFPTNAEINSEYTYTEVKMEDTTEVETIESELSIREEKPAHETHENDFEEVKTLDKKSHTEEDNSTEIEINKQGNINPEMDIATEDKNGDQEAYDPSLELSNYQKPVLELLASHDSGKVSINREELEENKNQIIRTLSNYNIDITKIRATIGPTVTLYEIVPAPGVRISKIKNLEDDIALSLAALGIRIIAPIPGKGTIGIEVPNKKKQIVSLKEIIQHEKFASTNMALPIALGKTISNEVFIADLAKMPHLLMAGATGQGKSVGINAILISLLYHNHPSKVKLVLIDPKKVELFPYGGLENHFLAMMPGQHEPIITDTTKVIETLNSLCIEMDQRYDLLKRGRARNIREYNKKFVDRQLNPLKGHKYLPFIVLVIDEFADLIMTAGKDIEMPIARLAQLARAVGIHLVIATQRPSVNIITGIIKANFPARVAYKVTSKIDSRTILDGGGADQLIGRGDMLLSVSGNIIRLQCAFVDTPEVEKVLDFIADQQGYPEPYLLPEFSTEESAGPGGISIADLDEMFSDAASLVVSAQSGSTSMIQRKLKLGFNRAGRIMDQLEAFGIVGPSEGSKAREVHVHSDDELQRLLKEIFQQS